MSFLIGDRPDTTLLQQLDQPARPASVAQIRVSANAASRAVGLGRHELFPLGAREASSGDLAQPLFDDADVVGHASGSKSTMLPSSLPAARILSCELCRPLPELLERARDRLTRTLTEAERSEFGL